MIATLMTKCGCQQFVELDEEEETWNCIRLPLPGPLTAEELAGSQMNAGWLPFPLREFQYSGELPGGGRLYYER